MSTEDRNTGFNSHDHRNPRRTEPRTHFPLRYDKLEISDPSASGTGTSTNEPVSQLQRQTNTFAGELPTTNRSNSYSTTYPVFATTNSKATTKSRRVRFRPAQGVGVGHSPRARASTHSNTHLNSRLHNHNSTQSNYHALNYRHTQYQQHQQQQQSLQQVQPFQQQTRSIYASREPFAYYNSPYVSASVSPSAGRTIDGNRSASGRSGSLNNSNNFNLSVSGELSDGVTGSDTEFLDNIFNNTNTTNININMNSNNNNNNNAYTKNNVNKIKNISTQNTQFGLMSSINNNNSSSNNNSSDSTYEQITLSSLNLDERSKGIILAMMPHASENVGVVDREIDCEVLLAELRVLKVSTLSNDQLAAVKLVRQKVRAAKKSLKAKMKRSIANHSMVRLAQLMDENLGESAELIEKAIPYIKGLQSENEQLRKRLERKGRIVNSQSQLESFDGYEHEHEHEREISQPMAFGHSNQIRAHSRNNFGSANK